MSNHNFHIPVMGLGYTIDTPIKVAHYGIDSVVSIVQDDLIEKARKYYAKLYQQPFELIKASDPDHRHKRITAYLNLMKTIVQLNFTSLLNDETEKNKHISLLPDHNKQKQLTPGSIDVNIMTKVDRKNNHTDLTDAVASLKGFAESDLTSSIVLSAGINPRLFAAFEQYADFYPSQNFTINKKVVLKVSDFRSAKLQGQMLAKKGIWVSEFRIESGLNCGGHAFATNGNLIGEVLYEFKNQRSQLKETLYQICAKYWQENEMTILESNQIDQKITVQGGIGSSAEHEMLLSYFEVDATGWGSPFLLVPEATTIDGGTLKKLANATSDDIYNSNYSPLGIGFNVMKDPERDALLGGKEQSGSPCLRKHLALNEEGVCVASLKHQKRELAKLGSEENISESQLKRQKELITEKACLCEGLSTSFLIKTNMLDKRQNETPIVCPGPNIAYFDRTYSLKEMVDHIYGRTNVVTMERPHFLLKELTLYTEHFEQLKESENANQKQVNSFYKNLLKGITQYEDQANELKADLPLDDFLAGLTYFKNQIETIQNTEVALA